MIECPECGQKAVSFCRDIIRAYHTSISKNGSVKVSSKAISTNELDNCWLECNSCHLTSEDSEALEEIFENIDWC